ncbi:hypothetical protein CA85_49100 [Allorhodopirellula solitaria]|uniref:Uncharacterized protein n=1 Tax=Allorhodopirellula solitaria TaxID=2527987 RepID=A0A5C5WXV7_9BACT|nr:hypothetical protein CA85_49100 [Allorhodopirellula solitaria]
MNAWTEIVQSSNFRHVGTLAPWAHLVDQGSSTEFRFDAVYQFCTDGSVTFSSR